MSPTTHNRVGVLHGVNLNMLGRRPSEHYGDLNLDELEVGIKRYARELDIEARFFRTNSEAEYVEYLHRAHQLIDALILNPGAWTHYSWAIRDALEIASLPAVEVHISDISKREEWRRHSVLEGLVLKQIYGKGADGYREALDILAKELGT